MSLANYSDLRKLFAICHPGFICCAGENGRSGTARPFLPRPPPIWSADLISCQALC